jgi:stalled ribosome rescue protein Dom34
MKTTKKLGIWMDHTMAHIIELKNNSIISNTIESASLQGEKHNFGKDETLKQNTEQDQLAEYFKKIITVIQGYPEVILFGPTNAKTELYNLLKKDSHFNNTKIKIETTDNLTENQIQAYVKEHFEKVS